MCWMWVHSERRFDPVILMFFIFFQIHYFQRAFVFPLLLTGKSKMPLAIMSMGILLICWTDICKDNGYFILRLKECTALIGLCHHGLFSELCFFYWYAGELALGLYHPAFAKAGRYPPLSASKGMYRYVTSANYFGEIVEWAGWAILTCSLSGLVFLWWTIANLVPRANAIWHRYREEFGDEVGNRKRVFPFLY